MAFPFPLTLVPPEATPVVSVFSRDGSSHRTDGGGKSIVRTIPVPLWASWTLASLVFFAPDFSILRVSSHRQDGFSLNETRLYIPVFEMMVGKEIPLAHWKLEDGQYLELEVMNMNASSRHFGAYFLGELSNGR